MYEKIHLLEFVAATRRLRESASCIIFWTLLCVAKKNLHRSDECQYTFA